MRAVAGLLLLTTLASTAPAQAHHSLWGYDQGKLSPLAGVVTDFQFIQPHPFLVIEVEAGGAKQSWRLEMDNLWELRDIGMTAATFRRGDRVRVSGNADREGAHAMYLRRLDRPSDSLRYEQVGMRPVLNGRERS